MNSQFLSIAMCTYNGAKYLQEQLCSIANQTRLPDELVVCDDCSTDNTLNILESFKRTAPFDVKIYKNEKNLGPTKNFEKAISLCSGDIIALSDQDDVWMPQKLEKLEKSLRGHPNAGYAFSDALVVNENLDFLGYTMWEGVSFTTYQQKRFSWGHQLSILLKRNVVTGATMAFRASLREFALPIPKEWVHDAWIALLLSAIGKGGTLINEPLIKYRQHDKQVIGGKKLSLTEQYVIARVTKRESYIKEIDKLKQLLASLNNVNKLYWKTETLIRSKIRHLENRVKLYNENTRLIKKLKIIGDEFISANYHKFSKNFESIFKDLLVVIVLLPKNQNKKFR